MISEGVLFLRIIAGRAKGRRIAAPSGQELTRPTSDKTRGAIFSSIQFGLSGARVLDLFAGSGAMGLEALSRGADHATFVDNSSEAIAAIKDNARSLGFSEHCTILKKDALRALGELRSPFSFIFMDPPYASYDLYGTVIKKILGQRLLLDEGLIIVEHDDTMNFSEHFDVVRQKKYGRAQVSFIAGD